MLACTVEHLELEFTASFAPPRRDVRVDEESLDSREQERAEASALGIRIRVICVRQEIGEKSLGQILGRSRIEVPVTAMVSYDS